MIILVGVVKKIKYLNPITGFSVIQLSVDAKQLVTAKGVFGPLYTGYTLRVSGCWEQNDRGAGDVFCMTSFEMDEPTSTEGQYLLLTSGFFDGMTSAIAKYLIKNFGERTLSLLKEDINIVATAPRVGIKTFIKIRDSALSTFMQQERALELKTIYGWNLHEAIMIVNEFKDESIKIMQSRPYAMMSRLKIPFVRFDQVIQASGWPANDPSRIREILTFFLGESLKDGDTVVPVDTLIRNALSYSELDVHLVRPVFEHLVSIRWFSKTKNSKMIDVVQPKWLFGAEKEIAARLAKIVSTPAEKIMRFNPESPELSVLKHHQRLAVAGPFFHKFTIISGKPGAGKTTLVRTFLKMVKSQRLKYIALSPTGKASQRLREVINEDALTIHRALGATHDRDAFLYNDVNPLPYDLFLIDEFSMVDIRLFCSLLRAIPYSARVVLIGDVNQLPSVGLGAVLRDLILSNCFYVYWLTQVLRITKADGSPPTPLQVADAVLDGRVYTPKNDDEWQYCPTTNNQETITKVVDILNGLLDAGVPSSDIQVFSPTNGDELGVDSLNFVVKKVFKPQGHPCIEVGDKVMQRKNNYDLAVYNGDIGLVKSIDADIENANHKDPVMTVEVESSETKTVIYTKELMNQVSLAYALTGHKSQGSEYPYVVIVIPDNHVAFMDRHWFYTVLTRCQKQVFVVGNPVVLERTIKSCKSSNRHTMLIEHLHQIMPSRPSLAPLEISYRDEVDRLFVKKA